MAFIIGFYFDGTPSGEYHVAKPNRVSDAVNDLRSRCHFTRVLSEGEFMNFQRNNYLPQGKFNFA